MRVLVVGATGMLGYSLFSYLSDNSPYEVYGTVRSTAGKEGFFDRHLSNIFENIDVDDLNSIFELMKEIKVDVVINCIGLIKQYESSKNPINAISINSLLPHKLAEMCNSVNARLIHFSTDCVFLGTKGGYTEFCQPDAQDIYGKSKCLGEVGYQPHLTLRTSIIGHELQSSVSLVDWFLSQKVSTKGFSSAIFSGLPTCVIARMLKDHILPNNSLSGLYHLSVNPIDKYTLLSLIAEIYQKNIEITPSAEIKIDRSLNSDKFYNELGLVVPSWQNLIEEMHEDYLVKYKEQKEIC